METLLDLEDTHPSRDFGCVGLADEMLFPLDFAVCVEAWADETKNLADNIQLEEKEDGQELS